MFHSFLPTHQSDRSGLNCWISSQFLWIYWWHTGMNQGITAWCAWSAGFKSLTQPVMVLLIEHTNLALPGGLRFPESFPETKLSFFTLYLAKFNQQFYVCTAQDLQSRMSRMAGTFDAEHLKQTISYHIITCWTSNMSFPLNLDL